MNIFRKENGDIRIWIIFVGGILFVIGGVLSFNHILARITGLDFPADSGSFGDQFGVLNTTFAGLAFVGVICALFQQQNQIRRQDEIRSRNYKDLMLLKRFILTSTVLIIFLIYMLNPL